MAERNLVIYRYLPIGPDEGALSTDRSRRWGVIYRAVQTKGRYLPRCLPPSSTPWRPSLLNPSKLPLRLPRSRHASAAIAATRAAWRRAQGEASFKGASRTSRWVRQRRCSAASAGTFATEEEAAAAVIAAEEQLKAGNDPWQQPARKNQHARGDVRDRHVRRYTATLSPVLCVPFVLRGCRRRLRSARRRAGTA